MKRVTSEIEKVLTAGWFSWAEREKEKAARILEKAANDLSSNRVITEQFFVDLLEKLRHLPIRSDQRN